ncbi:MAG: asparagine synthase (glutamine-hydrolyzing) [Pseudomonadota bacterium]
MCGISGLLDFRAETEAEKLERLVCDMRDTLVHRGPDGAGVWVDAAAGIALGHRRLAIVDLSVAGNQPMLSASGRYVVVFNGEIYNFRELRRELPSTFQYRGHSDTEVLLAGIESWGVRESLRRFNGMFALALWDRQERALYLARDRFGEKPLYYGRAARGSLLFGSELKALRAHPEFHARIDRSSLANFLRSTYVPSPNTIFEGIRKLPPASFLRIAAGDDVNAEPVPYWSMQAVVADSRAQPFLGSLTEAVEQLDQHLRKAVQLRMNADVPLGAFLSGGIDSSLVVALMQQASTRPVKTFTIGFTEARYNEAEYAKAVAKHLGTEHTEHYATAQEALDVVPRLARLYDEPFADSSQIPTYLVSRLARQSVTVTLSGDAGDELFCGYSRYPDARRLWQTMSRLPLPLRTLASNAMAYAPDGLGDRMLGGLSGSSFSSARLRAASEIFGARDFDDLYRRMVSSNQRPRSTVIGASCDCDPILARLRSSHALPPIERMMLTDTLTYLPDDILTKVDRASMGVSLEARVPLLDPNVAAFAWRLPEAMKLEHAESKVIVRRLLGRYVPAALFDRPKMGFGVPLAQWLRAPLRAWADAQLDEASLSAGGYFRVRQVRKRWLEHRSGSRDWHRYLWPILMFQAWNES